MTILAIMLLGCSTNQLVTPTETSNPYPSNLLMECEDFKEYPSGVLKEIIIVHAENMQKGSICKIRHNELVRLIKARESK